MIKQFYVTYVTDEDTPSTMTVRRLEGDEIVDVITHVGQSAEKVYDRLIFDREMEDLTAQLNQLKARLASLEGSANMATQIGLIKY